MLINKRGEHRKHRVRQEHCERKPKNEDFSPVTEVESLGEGGEGGGVSHNRCGGSQKGQSEEGKKKISKFDEPM